MKIIVVGGTGTIGKAVVKELAERHTVIIAGHTHGDVNVDVTNLDSITAILTESMGAYGEYFYGFESVPAARVALAYSKSVEGAQTGQIYKVW